MQVLIVNAVDIGLVRSMRALGQQIIPEPDHEGFHTFPSIYHLHLHITKGKSTHSSALTKFQYARGIEDLYRRPLPVEDYLCHFAPFDLVEHLLETRQDLQQARQMYAEVGRLHPLDRYHPVFAHLFGADAAKRLAATGPTDVEADEEVIDIEEGLKRTVESGGSGGIDDTTRRIAS